MAKRRKTGKLLAAGRRIAASFRPWLLYNKALGLKEKASPQMLRKLSVLFFYSLASLLIFSGAAHAIKLEVDPDAPAWAHLGAAILLYSHIGGGVAGLFAGTTALIAKKGARVHRAAGTLFFAAMFVTYSIGGGVAPFLAEQQRPNFVAGVLALYLVISGWRTARRGDAPAGRGEVIGLVIALAITGAGLTFIRMGSMSPTGTVDGSPFQAFYIFTFAGAAAAAGELNMILRKGLTGAARIARHLWRMCFAFFIGSASLFLGQPQVFPHWFNASPAPFVLALAPFIAMWVWLAIVRFGKGFRDPAPGVAG